MLEVYRQPVRGPARRHGWKYESVRLLKRRAVVSPLAAPRARLLVADLPLESYAQRDPSDTCLLPEPP